MTDKQDQLDYLYLDAHKFFPLSLSLLFFFFFSMKKAARGCLDCYRVRADALSQISLRIGLLYSPGSERRKRISLDRFFRERLKMRNLFQPVSMEIGRTSLQTFSGKASSKGEPNTYKILKECKSGRRLISRFTRTMVKSANPENHTSSTQ